MTMIQNGSMILLGFAFLLWFLGGWLIATRAFDLPPGEQSLVGFAIGLTAGNWTANLLAQIMPLPYACWLAALLILAAGVAAAWPLDFRALFISARQSIISWLILGGIILVMWKIGRGLAIFDDYQNLPTVSMMATGDVPPHFSLDPSVRFGYHYFLLFLASQFMRLGDMYPFTALDLARAVTFGLMLVLTALWVRRVTSSRLAGWLAGALAAFSSGLRWLLLLFPISILNKIAAQTTLMGSGADSGESLVQNLLGTWAIDGAGPLPFPFAFVSGVHQSLAMTMGGIGVFDLLILVILLMTADRWKNWSAAVVSTVLLASLALANEVALGILLAGALVALISFLIIKRTWRLPRSLLPLGIAAACALVIACLQGGMLTEVARRLLPGGGKSYYDVAFALAWPPMVVSSHLGPLAFNNIWKILLAFLELGPIILVFPLIVWFGIKVVSEERWFEAVLIGAALVSLFTVFLRYSGTGGITGTSRLLGPFLFVCTIFAVPVLWDWVQPHSEHLKVALLVGWAVTIFSGVILFDTELIAAGKPVSTSFMNTIDVQMEKQYWNRLEPDALIFDPIPNRPPVVFGRFTNAYTDWYDPKPAWKAFLTKPDPYALHAAGFDYMYYGISFWEELNFTGQALLESPCGILVKQIDGNRSDTDARSDYRRLVDIRNCK